MRYAHEELREIGRAWAELASSGESAALCSVVGATGSTYRRVGARMLVAEGGECVGAISGGCLDKAVIEQSRAVLASGVPIVVSYDTRSEADVVWGFGLGCRGRLEVLIEPIRSGAPGAEHVAFLGGLRNARESCVCATVVAATGTASAAVGERWVFPAPLSSERSSGPEPVRVFSRLVRRDASACLEQRENLRKTYRSARGSASVLFEYFEPPASIVIFGAGRDALPLVRLAKIVGLRVVVVDPRQRECSRERFAEAHEVMLCRPRDAHANLQVTGRSAAVLMTHDYLLDRELLESLLCMPFDYVGVLGPRRRTARLVDELCSEEPAIAARAAAVRAPIGLDLGADSPAEIALAIMAELTAVLNGRSARALTDLPGPIHSAASRVIRSTAGGHA